MNIHQQGTYAPGTADGIHRWMGSVAMDSFGNMALGYSASNATTTFPSSWYTGRLAGDPLGTLPQGEGSIVNGTGSQTGTQRWGDYTSMNVDPVDDCTFWYVNEWVPVTSGAGWQLPIGAFRFADCRGEPATIHVGDLDGRSRNADASWQARVTVLVHDDGENAVSGALVSFDVSGVGSRSCTTTASGTCSVAAKALDSVPNLTFTVTAVAKGGFVYDPGANHDPDGDSNGTAIVVGQP